MRYLQVGILLSLIVAIEYVLLRKSFHPYNIDPDPPPAVFLAYDFPGLVAQWPALRASRWPDQYSVGPDEKKEVPAYSCKCPLLGKSPYEFHQCGVFNRQIARDLSPFQMVNMTPAVLDLSYNHTTSNVPPSYHFSIKNNVIRYKARNDGAYKDQLLAMLSKLQRVVKLPDVEFVLNSWDHPKSPFQDKVPLLSPCSNPARSDIVYPYMYAYDTEREEEDGNGFKLRQDLHSECQSRNFLERVPKAHFRGGCTGPEFRYQGPLYKYYTRARANMLTETYPDLIDAGLVFDCVDQQEGLLTFSHLPDENALEEHSDERRPRPLVHNDPTDWCKYRYYLLLDGNTVSGRSMHIIQMGFVLFKPESPFYEYWYTLLEPWVHYIPVNADLNDLPEKVRWANNHPEKAEKIAQNLGRLADVISLEETWLCYWWRLLQGIADLQNFQSRIEGFEKHV